MKNLLLNITIKIARWLMTSRGTQLVAERLMWAGWDPVSIDGRIFFIEPTVKIRDRVWIEFENHYYRVYHGEKRTFIALESSKEWLQMYLFSLDKYLECSTRELL